MRRCTLKRISSTVEGTFGVLSCNKKSWFTLELPWKDNQPKVSCIPLGVYECKVRKSPRFGKVYHITNVEGRSFILMHSGNYAGDVTKGYRSHVEGCILLGKKTGTLDKQRAVLLSKVAVREFMEEMQNEPFTLEIKNA